jgi:putative mycofactocin binding protein MftB
LNISQGPAMKSKTDKRYKLASGSQVREEDFGLLFYTMSGPRLYFMSSGALIGMDFFQGMLTLDQYMERHSNGMSLSWGRISDLRKGLSQLTEKGVIIEC